MDKNKNFTITDGLAVFGPEIIQILNKLDTIFVKMSEDFKAKNMTFPALMKVGDLSSLDYFDNFPHLGLAVAGLTDEACSCITSQKGKITTVSQNNLKDSDYLLPSAACYNVYLHLRNEVVTQARYYTTAARCFRNESEYKGLERLWSFQMREIICIGSMDEVQAFLSFYKDKVSALSEQIGIVFDIEVATDPFYDKQGTKALMQKLQPVKEEFVFESTVSAASLNFHRNFFGEKCNILNNKGEAVFSGCVAFGLERWLHALLKTYGHDLETIQGKLNNA